MKDRRKQILLIVATIVIWGVIAYQFFSIVAPEDPVVAPRKAVLALADTVEQEGYQLIVSYRDPFIRSREKIQNKKIVAPSQEVRRENSAPAVQINLDGFRFLGSVENEETKEKVALVNFQGKMHMLRKNDVIQGVSIIKVFKDSVHVSVNNQKKVIYRAAKL